MSELTPYVLDAITFSADEKREREREREKESERETEHAREREGSCFEEEAPAVSHVDHLPQGLRAIKDTHRQRVVICS